MRSASSSASLGVTLLATLFAIMSNSPVSASDLLDAVQAGDTRLVQTLLSEGADANELDLN